MNCKALGTLVLATAFAPALAGCSTTSQTGMLEDTRMGESVKQTMAAQVIDPAPVYEYLDPPTSGEHAAQVITRYRTNKVKQPVRESSTSAVGGN